MLSFTGPFQAPRTIAARMDPATENILSARLSWFDQAAMSAINANEMMPANVEQTCADHPQRVLFV